MRATHLIKNAVSKRLVACFLLLIATAGSASAQDAVNLTEILYSKLSGDTVQINIVTDGEVAKPGSFSTNQPARIALDFFGVKKRLAKNTLKISAGKVDSIVAVETPDRTRVIINLIDSARYDVVASENGYAVTVFNDNDDLDAVAAPKAFAARPDLASEIMITNVDFRRSEAGGGTLIVDLTDDDVTVDTREKDGDIIVDLLGVNLPAELERRLDVTDFATPVQSIDAFQNAGNVRVVIVPQGKQQHLSFQSGNRFTLTVDPVVEKTEEELADEKDLALGYSGERLSINFQNIDVRSALTVIADFTGINFVTSDSVTGEITINLKDVPWDQALDVIMRSKGLAKRQKGNVIWVAPADEIAQTEAEELVAKALFEDKAPLVSEIIQINYAKASDISEVVKSVKPNEDNSNRFGIIQQFQEATEDEEDGNSLLTKRGSVTVDERTNSLLVQDIAPKIKELRALIAKLDKPVRQVLIETRIVEANDTFSRELGARLGFQRVTENAQFPGSSGSNLGTVISGGSVVGNTTLFDSVFDEEDGLVFDQSTGTPGGLAVDLGADQISGQDAASYAFDIFRSGNGFAHLITLELSALEADGRGKIVASPRLVTANQKRASISQGSEIFVTIPGNGGGVGGGGGGLERIEAELKLIVTPQITPDDRIVLDVEINQDVLISTGPTIVGTKQIETQVLSDNGETIVIGGIYQENNTEGETKVPFLGDIPVIRHLFRKKSKVSNRTELLIFLTPKIISPKLNLG